jgi:hypothetical protein
MALVPENIIMGTCKLCLMNKVLLKKSHILPDFIYRDLRIYDKTHKINLIAFDKQTFTTRKISKGSSGEFEGNILCAECDNNILGKYETYAKKAMFSNELPIDQKIKVTNYHSSNNVYYSHAENINYKLFKLFLLSLLWRIGISTRPLFNKITLDKDVEEMIRQMLLKGDPGSITNIPILGLTFLNDKEMPRDILGQPSEYEINGSKIVKLPLGGIIVLYHISTDAEDQAKIKNQILNDDNVWNIIHIEKGKGWEYLFK